MRLPKVIQTVFHFGDHDDIAHDYYLNASWVIELLQRQGERSAGDFFRRAIDAKREKCVKRYGEEWGKAAITVALKRQRREAAARASHVNGNTSKINQNTTDA